MATKPHVGVLAVSRLAWIVSDQEGCPADARLHADGDRRRATQARRRLTASRVGERPADAGTARVRRHASRAARGRVCLVPHLVVAPTGAQTWDHLDRTIRSGEVSDRSAVAGQASARRHLVHRGRRGESAGALRTPGALAGHTRRLATCGEFLRECSRRTGNVCAQ